MIVILSLFLLYNIPPLIYYHPMKRVADILLSKGGEGVPNGVPLLGLMSDVPFPLCLTPLFHLVPGCRIREV